MSSRVGDAVETRWLRIFLLGIAIWLVTLMFSYILYWVDIFDHQYYMISTTGISALTVLFCSLKHLCSGVVDSRLEGLIIGLFWMIEATVLQAAFLYFMPGDPLQYVLNDAWMNAHMLPITLLSGFYCHIRGNRLPGYDPAAMFQGPVRHR